MNTGPVRESNIKKIASNKSYSCVLLFAVILLLLLVSLISINKTFDPDEFEHIHSAWYVENNFVPYSDFFQHHHPFFWYLIVPFLFIFGHSVKTVIVLRMFIFILAIGSIFVTYSIAQKITRSRETSLLSIVLLLSMVLFIEKSVEIRPDVPQVLSGLISIYFLIVFFQMEDRKHILFSALSASFSFLFLQKTIFLLMAYALIFIFRLLKKNILMRHVFYFIGYFLLPLLLYWGYLLTSGSFKDYVLTNWLINIHHLDTFSPLRFLVPSLIQNYVFWLLSVFSLIFILRDKTGEELKIISCIGVFLLFSVFLVRSPYKQYFMFAIPLLCITSGYFLNDVFDRFRFKAIHKILTILLLVISPLFFLSRMSVNSNHQQLKKVDFVIQHSHSSDLVYDGNNRFNLYRPDLHYFWYSVGEKGGLRIYNKLTEGTYNDYDICTLIISKRPEFISDYNLTTDMCRLDSLYDKTLYKGLYQKRLRS